MPWKNGRWVEPGKSIPRDLSSRELAARREERRVADLLKPAAPCFTRKHIGSGATLLDLSYPEVTYDTGYRETPHRGRSDPWNRRRKKCWKKNQRARAEHHAHDWERNQCRIQAAEEKARQRRQW